MLTCCIRRYVLLTPSEYFRYSFARTPWAHNFSCWTLLFFSLGKVVVQSHGAALTLPRRARSSISVSLFATGFILLCLTLSSTSRLPLTPVKVAAAAHFCFIQCLALALGVTHARLQTAVLLLVTGDVARRFIAWQSAGPLILSAVQQMIGLAFYRQNRSLAWASGHTDPREYKWATPLFFVATLIFLGLAIAFLCTERELNHQDEHGSELDKNSHSDKHPSRAVTQPHIALRCCLFASISAVTYSVFPSLTSRIRSSYAQPGTALALQLVFSSFHFVLFHVGRCIGQCARLTMHTPTQAVLTLARIAFIPFFRACNFPTALQNITVTDALHRVPSILACDTAFLPLLFCFGLTDGLLDRSLRLSTPDTAEHSALRLWSLSHSTGKLVGACLSMISVRW